MHGHNFVVKWGGRQFGAKPIQSSGRYGSDILYIYRLPILLLEVFWEQH